MKSALLWTVPTFGHGGREIDSMRSLAACSLLTHLCSVLTVFLLARHLEIDSYGLLIFGLTLQSYLLSLGCLGTKIVVVREGVLHPGRLDEVATSHLVITGCASTLLCALTMAASAIASLNGAERFLLCCFALGNIASCANIYPLFDVHHRQGNSAAITLGAEFVAMLTIAWLCASGRVGLRTVGVTFAGKWVATTVAHYLIYHRYVRRLHFQFSTRALYLLFGSSWPVMFSSLVATLPFSLGIVLVRWWQGDSAVAILGIGQQAALGYIMIATIGSRIIHPHAAAPYGRGTVFLTKLVVLYGGFLLSLLFGATTVGVAMVNLLLNPAYQAAVLPMILLLAGALIHCVGTISTAYLVMMRSEVSSLIANLFALLVYFLGCCLVVPRYSYNGAALMTICAAFVAAAIMIIQVRSKLITRSGIQDLPFPAAEAGNRRVGCTGLTSPCLGPPICPQCQSGTRRKPLGTPS
jgi:O-antigen/teichoic acid export membrane protein